MSITGGIKLFFPQEQDFSAVRFRQCYQPKLGVPKPCLIDINLSMSQYGGSWGMIYLFYLSSLKRIVSK